MTWTTIRWHLTNVTMYNESTANIADSGLVTRTKGTEKTIGILIMNSGTMFFYGENGRFTEDGIKFQVDKKMLDDNSFEVLTGRTFLVYNGNTYRVLDVKDYKEYPHVKLIECKAVRIIDVE